MKTYHIAARQRWDDFAYNDKLYSLRHLDCHEVIFVGAKKEFNFIVTYGLHCFAKCDQEHSIGLYYADGMEERQINLERYHLSKHLRRLIEKLDDKSLLFETAIQKYFTFEQVNDLSGKLEICKVCLCVFKENRLLRIHVTSAFFDREGAGKSYSGGQSIFKVAMDAQRRPRSTPIPKEATRK